MGKISESLSREFRSAERSTRRGKRSGSRRAARDVVVDSEELPDIEELVELGHDPLHAVYILAQNFSSLFAERISELEEFDEYCEIVGDAQDEYLPGGPPMSPLSMSYFTLWAFFDVRFGPDRETIGTCLLDLADALGMDEIQVEATRNLQQSRMGIYEHCGTSSSLVRLRELVTGCEFHCRSTSGYRGKKGELWYCRLCPPLADLAEFHDYHIVMTSPYVLINTTVDDWTAYLKKNIAGSPEDPAAALADFLKFGPTLRHWHEFVLEAYHHHQFDAIFLAGLPDVKGSLPHAG